MIRVFAFAFLFAALLLEAPAQPVNVGDRIHDSLTAGNGKWETSKITADTVEGAVYIGAGSVTAQDVSDSLSNALDSGTRDIDVRNVTISNGALDFPTTSIFEGDVDWMSVSALRFTLSGGLRVIGGVGFYGKEPPVAVPCVLPSSTPPNPVTAAQARAAYDLALQNCLDESGVNLVNTP